MLNTQARSNRVHCHLPRTTFSQFSTRTICLFSREPCLSVNAIKDMNWDLSQWLPLVEDRSFLPWLVKMPTEKELLRARSMSAQQVSYCVSFN